MLLVTLSETVSSFQRMLHVSPLLSHTSNSCPHSTADARNPHIKNRVVDPRVVSITTQTTSAIYCEKVHSRSHTYKPVSSIHACSAPTSKA